MADAKYTPRLKSLYDESIRAKLTALVVGFKYAPASGPVGRAYMDKCFCAVFADGRDDAVSISKCVDVSKDVATANFLSLRSIACSGSAIPATQTSW